MAETMKYQCDLCGHIEEIAVGDTVPLCCGQPMAPLPVCRVASVAEHARLGNEDEPCDDGRAGKSEG